MATELDLEFVPLALELIEELGKPVLFTIETKTHDLTGKVTVTGTASHTRNITPPEPFDSRYVDGTLIKQDDVQCYVAASGLPFTPAKGIKVAIDGKLFHVEATRSVYSGEQVALYWMQLR